MDETLRLSGYREPLGLWVHSASRIAERPTLRVRDIEFSSRGDRVPGRVILPADGAGPLPLVLLQTEGPDTTREAVAGLGAAWAEDGAAVASIDLPLHGARADQKLLELLPGAGDTPPPWRRALADEFTRQSVIDLERPLDALCALEWIDADRIAYVGFGLGARIGSAFCALDARVRAAALAPHPGGPETPGADPTRWIGLIAPRPVLLLGATASETGDSVESISFDLDPSELPVSAAPSIARFLAHTFREA
jgi:dienelactone hydrolase